MKVTRKVAPVSTLVLLVGLMQAVSQNLPAGQAAPTLRYSGTAEVKARDAKTATRMHVEVKDWNLLRTSQPTQFPAKGFYLVQLNSGRIDTEIGGQLEHRVAGDLWTVPEGATMSITFPARSQSAQLKTIALAAGGR